jgi:hypothetical protein
MHHPPARWPTKPAAGVVLGDQEVNITGMPSFGAIDVPDQETWSIVALVKRLPSVTDEDYKAWTAPAAPVPASAR